jgi:hypothetical protein
MKRETMQNWLPLLGGILTGFGVGTVVTSIVNHFLARRASMSDRWYQERREAYLGMIAAIQSLRGDVPAWHARCALFGSPEVMKYAAQVAETSDEPYDTRNEGFKKMLEAMRNDLQR